MHVCMCVCVCLSVCLSVCVHIRGSVWKILTIFLWTPIMKWLSGDSGDARHSDCCILISPLLLVTVLSFWLDRQLPLTRWGGCADLLSQSDDVDKDPLSTLACVSSWLVSELDLSLPFITGLADVSWDNFNLLTGDDPALKQWDKDHTSLNANSYYSA